MNWLKGFLSSGVSLCTLGHDLSQKLDEAFHADQFPILSLGALSLVFVKYLGKVFSLFYSQFCMFFIIVGINIRFAFVGVMSIALSSLESASSIEFSIAKPFLGGIHFIR
jgi:hypothetical protein